MIVRPYAQRLMALRAAKAPGCGCGVVHGPGREIHENRESGRFVDSADFAAGREAA